MEMKAYMDGYIIGQENAKIALAVAVYNHYKRIYLAQDSDVELQKSTNVCRGFPKLKQHRAFHTGLSVPKKKTHCQDPHMPCGTIDQAMRLLHQIHIVALQAFG